jgi:hypothetical protein
MPDVEQSVYIDLESQTWIKEDPVPLVATETHSSTFFFCLRIGWRWILIILGLALYGLLLLPGFVQGEFLSGLVSKYAPLFHNMWSCMTHTHIPRFNVCQNYAIRCQSIL